MERGADQQTAALSEHVRQAQADFVPPEGVDEEEAARLRSEVGRRAMFDPSKEATLARKYEAAAERAFFRCLKELRQMRWPARGRVPGRPGRAWGGPVGSLFAGPGRRGHDGRRVRPDVRRDGPLATSRAGQVDPSRADGGRGGPADLGRTASLTGPRDRRDDPPDAGRPGRGARGPIRRGPACPGGPGRADHGRGGRPAPVGGGASRGRGGRDRGGARPSKNVPEVGMG